MKRQVTCNVAKSTVKCVPKEHPDSPKSDVIRSIEDLPLVLKHSDISKIMGISKNSTYSLMQQKGFPAYRVGKQIRVNKDDFIKWLGEQKNQNSVA